MNSFSKYWRRAIPLLLLLAAIAGVYAAERFPPPDFGTGYVYPQSDQTPARAGWKGLIDMAALLAALGWGAYASFTGRSRRTTVWLSIASIAYFGFYRKGCVCPIGAIQNVAAALLDSSLVLPLVVIVFFAAPLLVALFFGRVFCGGVCPFGAVQDLILLKPISVPRWLDIGLSYLRYVYMGLAILFSVMGASYLICKYDPFVGLFRMSARFDIWMWSLAVLLTSLFIGRPYCRYLCPYGALLGIVSRFSLWRVTVTPDRCIVCGLCREACPYGAIREADVIPGQEEDETATARPKLTLAHGALLALLPLAGALLGWFAGPALSGSHYLVQTADRVALEEAKQLTDRTFQSEAFRSTGRTFESLYEQARQTQAGYKKGGAWFGGWCGFMAAMMMLGIVLERRRTRFDPSRAHCVECSRCYLTCPIERERLGLPTPELSDPPSAS